MTTKLSEHFTLEELVFSENAARLGIDNIPTKEEIQHALDWLIPGIEEVRKYLGFPMFISSGFRSKALNDVTPGSSDTSQHTKFEAVDFTCPGYGSVLTVAKAIVVSPIKFDQLIYEYGSWIHISFSEYPRHKILSKHTGQPYVAGIILPDGKRIL